MKPAAPIVERSTIFGEGAPPHELGGVVFLPGSEAETDQTTLSHEAVHAAISRGLPPFLIPARMLAGLLPDAFNPEEELAYRLESPRDPYALKLRASTRRTHPYLAFLSGLYGGGRDDD